jgi:hypothetical protein
VLVTVNATDPNGVATAACPANTAAVGGGGDCALCAPNPVGVLFELDFNSTHLAFIAACTSGCAHATVRCIGSPTAGAISTDGAEPTPQTADDLETQFRAYRDALVKP